MTKFKKKPLIIILTLLGLYILVSAFVSVYTYFTEINEIGNVFVSVATKNLAVSAVTFLCIFITVSVIALIWNGILKKNLGKITLSDSFLNKNGLYFPISAAIGLLCSILFCKSIAGNVLLAFNSLPSGNSDPIFDKDFSYYMLQRPLLIEIKTMLSSLFVFLLIYSIVIYVLYYIKSKEELSVKGLLSEKCFVRHVILNVAVIFLIKVLTFKFTREDLLFTGETRVGGGYTDIHIWLNFYRIAPFILLGIIVLCTVFLFKARYKSLIITALCYPLSFVIVFVIAGATQSLTVKPNEGSKESKYIQYNIDATRYGYNLTDVSEMEYPVEDNINAEVIADNREIVDNIRITDHSATITAFNQLQGIRNFYKFYDADIVPSESDGKINASFVSVRELSGELPSETYVNDKMKYTHGYGIVKSPINEVTSEGQPEFAVKNIPLTYSENEQEITQPRIYFGEAEPNYHIVNTKQAEIDYANGTDEFEFNYDGNSGIKLTAANRLIYAFAKRDINLLTSSYISSDSRLIINNNVIKRLNKALPFLTFDEDIHVAVSDDGSLKWIADGYTASGYLPYSQYTEGINYVRNSVKAVVDAYTGDVTVYVIDKNDPIIMTYNKIYPSVFSKEDLPESIKKQIKYPEWLFSVQAKIYTKYHVTNPATFYAGSDVWEIAREKYGTDAGISEVAPYYNITSLVDGKPEFVIMLPYTLKNKDNNLVGWLGARTSGENYGKFVSYNFPAGKHVYGTLQIENKIDNDPDISREITLWSQGGSSVMRGNLLVIPINNSIIYVEPLYITSENQASLPEVKRIIVAYGDRIVMEDSLDKAFEKLFGTSEIPSDEPEKIIIVPEEIIPSDSVLPEVRNKYAELKDAASKGDWAAFGKAMEEIDKLLAE